MWANSGLDLHVGLDPIRKTDSLERTLRDAIRVGTLTPGDRMPPSRSLAADLGISRNSVAEVYGRLASEGWLEARVGAGTWVAAVPAAAMGDAAAPERRRGARARLDLRAGIPDATAFPVAAWVAATRRALAATPTSELGYGDAAGAEQLRTALAGYVSRARGVWASADAVHVTHGFGHLLALVGGALVDGGARVIAVEEYGHALHRDILRGAGLEVVSLPVDGDGAVPVSDRRVDAVLLTPAHQFPTGAVLTPLRRAAFADWARRTGGIVIEDDYDGEFRYDRRAVGALQALAPDHVVYAGTASKALTPALGLAWGVLPSRLAAGVAERARVAGAATDVLSQVTLAEFLRRGDYDRAVRSSRARYRARRERLDLLVAGRLPDARLSSEWAGLQCVLELPPGMTEREATDAAASRSLSLEGLSSYREAAPGSPARPEAMVVGFGAPPPHLYEEALSVLSEVIARR